MEYSKCTIAKILVLSAVALLSGVVGAKALQGFVDYSADERQRLLRTEDFIYVINPASLTKKEKEKFDQIGSRVSLHLSPETIISAWPIVPVPKKEILAENEGDLRREPDSIQIHNGILTLCGTVLPNISNTDGFIEVSGTIFHFDKNKLPANERNIIDSPDRHASIHLPPTAIYFAWPSTPTEPLADADAAPKLTPELDHFEFKDHSLSIRGRTQYSPDEMKFVVESKNTFFLIDRSVLSEATARSIDTPGTWVSLQIPAKRISMVWMQNQAPPPEPVLRAPELQ